jgi:hypothetical protein
MNPQSHDDDLYRCDLCHRAVDPDTRARARRAWQPLIICDRCVRDADAQWSGSRRLGAAASAVTA